MALNYEDEPSGGYNLWRDLWAAMNEGGSRSSRLWCGVGMVALGLIVGYLGWKMAFAGFEFDEMTGGDREPLPEVVWLTNSRTHGLRGHSVGGDGSFGTLGVWVIVGAAFVGLPGVYIAGRAMLRG